MQFQILRSVAFTDVLSRLPDGVDHHRMMDWLGERLYVSSYSATFPCRSLTLVPWDDVMSDLEECFAELGWLPFDANHVFPADTFTYNPPTFVDLEG